MNGLSAFGMGFARGLEDKRVRKMEDEDRDFLRQDRAMRVEDREFARQQAAQQGQWREEDRATAEAERERQEQERLQVEAKLGRPLAVFQAEMLKMKGEVEQADLEWQKQNGGKLRDMEMQRAKAGLSAQQMAMGDAAHARSRRTVIEGRQDQQYEDAQQQRMEAEERDRIARVARRPDGTLDPEMVLAEYSKSTVLDPGKGVYAKLTPAGRLFIESDTDGDGNSETNFVDPDDVQDFVQGILDPTHWERVAAARAAQEDQANRFAQQEYGKNARAGLTATADPERALEFANSLAPNPNESQGGGHGGSPYPEGTELQGADGRRYVVKNGEPVPIE